MADKQQLHSVKNSSEVIEPDESNPENAEDSKDDWFGRLLALVHNETDNRSISRQINADASALVNRHQMSKRYHIMCIHDDNLITQYEADKIYRCLEKFDKKKPILLVVNSPGGMIEPAYMISKLCNTHARGKFVVVVPRRAKSAATLICCGANEIHMGQMSELGPIDPQINGKPALAVKASLEHWVAMSSQHEASASMIARYLALSLPVETLGYYERVTESAIQYAERLLHKAGRATPEAIARRLVYFYKDHGFVIDTSEAQEIFGEETICSDTGEYKLANELYQFLSFAQLILNLSNKTLDFCGAVSEGASVYSKTASSRSTKDS